MLAGLCTDMTRIVYLLRVGFQLFIGTDESDYRNGSGSSCTILLDSK